jgi:NAD(P)H-dependent flavin oxidoreductase YrpB (nitropropane dioxygenase family)
MPLHGMLIAEAQGRMRRSAASNEGARQLVNYFVGQVVGQMNQVKPAKQVVYEMVEEFIDAAERVSGLLED